MPHHHHWVLLFAPSLSLSQEVSRLEGRGRRGVRQEPPIPSALACGGYWIP